MSREWTPQQEADNLARRFEGVNQSAFAKKFEVPGGPSMVSQHIKARRPINMDAAIAYARGFEVALAEISPRLAAQVSSARLEDHSGSDSLSLITVGAESITPVQAALHLIGELLRAMTPPRREAVAGLLSVFAKDPDDPVWVRTIEGVLTEGPRADPAQKPPDEKQA